ncbi:MAG TPA: zinc ribbon domain-containing protein [Ktedonosporobacter sp.]|nr:zinc ribbon domain-containing protein [Ktedonosporobacter sp.]
MFCPKCNEPLEAGASFCGNCGNQVAPIYARGATIGDAANRARVGDRDRIFPVQSPPRLPISSPAHQPQRSTPPFPAMTPRSPRFDNGPVLIITLSLLVIVITGGLIALIRNNYNGGGGSIQGQVSFSDNQGGQDHSNIVNINVSGLGALPSGSQYHAWLLNDQTEQILSLGILIAQDQKFTLNFTDRGTNLLGQGDKVEITQEQGDAKLPTGKVVLSATFPPLAFIHIKHLLVSFPGTPGNIGLMVGLREQARQLNNQAGLLKNASTGGNPLIVQCIAQNMIDIIEGAPKNRPRALPPLCGVLNITLSGDGFGLLGSKGYVATASTHASLAATQADSTDAIKTQAKDVIIADDNVKGWATTVDQDAHALLTNPGDAAKIQEIATLSDHILNGVDTDNDESIDPVPGEAGAITGYIHAQLMATLTLAP